MALFKLNPEFKGFAGWLELKDERPGPLRTHLLFAPFAPRFVPRQSTLHDAVEHLDHFLLSGLPGDLQQERLRKNSMLHALLAQRIGYVAQRKRLRHRRARPANLLVDILMRVFKLGVQPVQSVRFFKWRQVLALNIFDEPQLERL